MRPDEHTDGISRLQLIQRAQAAAEPRAVPAGARRHARPRGRRGDALPRQSHWLGGGFLGVEVFFVISGYLITLLLIGEHERTGRVNLGQFWLRRFRRLLPAVLTMMGAVAVYMALFNREPQGRTRGDFLGGIFYISNWYQIFVGQGYTANEAFVPFRHLWSLAVEEQFYLIWPLVMVVHPAPRPQPSAACRAVAVRNQRVRSP